VTQETLCHTILRYIICLLVCHFKNPLSQNLTRVPEMDPSVYLRVSYGKSHERYNEKKYYRLLKGAWLSERLRRWSNKPDIVGSIPVTTEFFLISCDSNQVSKWFGTHNNLEVPLVKW